MTITAADFDVAFEALLDRTACLVPKVEEFFFAGVGISQPWTPDPLGLLFDFVLLGAGGGGGAIGTHPIAGSTGGGGGGGGAYKLIRVSRSLLSGGVLDVTVGLGGLGASVLAGWGANGGPTAIEGSGFLLVAEGGYGGRSGFDGGTPGAGGGTPGAAPGFQLSYAGQFPGAPGGGGGAAGDPGVEGHRGFTLRGGTGGTDVLAAQGGFGFGAGGGAGGGPGSPGPGTPRGGGGGGGYGGVGQADPGAAQFGGQGSQGYAMIVTWRGAAI